MRFPFDKPMPRISSPYGWRVHPIEKVRKHHNGVDYAGALGTPVHAIEAGTVIFACPHCDRRCDIGKSCLNCIDYSVNFEDRDQAMMEDEDEGDY